MDDPVLCVGGLVLDRRVRSLDRLVPATSNPATVELRRGGVAGNVACDLARRRGVAAALVSCVGEDDAGRFLVDHVAAAGVDPSGVRVVPGAASAQYLALLQPDGELYAAAAVMDVLAEITLDDARPRWPAAGGRVFADTNLSARVLAQVIGLARETGAQLAVDVVSVPKAMRLPLDLSGIAVLFGNLDEARALAGSTGAAATSQPRAEAADDAADDAADCARELVARGAGAVVVTLGADGALVLDGDRGVVHVPGVPVHVRDVTGAGDALVAATLADVRTGAPLPAAVRAGVVAAANAIA